MTPYPALSAGSIARGVRDGQFSVEQITETALTEISAGNPVLNCFTEILTGQAIADARALDRRIGRGESVGPLAGVPFTVKNLFDVSTVTTLAGSKINRAYPAAKRDAVLVARLKASGGVLVGCNTMDEYAYGFTTENAHDGVCRNPHDIKRVAGGSSGGSASSVAAGMVPLSLGSDTNGSIRVPSSFCGIFGLKPTYGRLPRTGSFPFVASFDHLGPFARSVADLALVYDVMQGYDPGDIACSNRKAEPASAGLGLPIETLRIGSLGGWFRSGADPQILQALDHLAGTLGATPEIDLPEAERARAAAFCITAAEGANLHLDRLRRQVHDFDPATRGRLLAGALLPATVLQQAHRFRQWFKEQVRDVFTSFDVLLAPSTPCVAPLIGQKFMTLGGVEVLTRPNIGLYTQPLSFIGLPIVSVPVWLDGGLPCGIQIIAPPWREDLALRVAASLERDGLVSAPVAPRGYS